MKGPGLSDCGFLRDLGLGTLDLCSTEAYIVLYGGHITCQEYRAREDPLANLGCCPAKTCLHILENDPTGEMFVSNGLEIGA